MDKTCGDVRDLFALGPDVTANERIAIESHVAVCSECARELAHAQALLGNLALLREGTMPPGASERIWRGVQSAVPGSKRPAAFDWLVRAAAVLVVGLTLGYTAMSVVGRAAEPVANIESAPGDDPSSTIVPNMQVPAGTNPGEDSNPAPRPQAWFLHHLPSVDGILDASVVRF